MLPKLFAAGLLAVRLPGAAVGSIFEAMPDCWLAEVASLLGAWPGNLYPSAVSLGGVGSVC